MLICSSKMPYNFNIAAILPFEFHVIISCDDFIISIFTKAVAERFAKNK